MSSTSRPGPVAPEGIDSVAGLHPAEFGADFWPALRSRGISGARLSSDAPRQASARTGAGSRSWELNFSRKGEEGGLDDFFAALAVDGAAWEGRSVAKHWSGVDFS